MKHLPSPARSYLAFLALVGAWIGAVYLLNAGDARTAVIVAGGMLVAVGFMGLLMQHVRAILGGTPHLILHGIAAGTQLAVFIVSFALVHVEIGLRDNTGATTTIIHAFWESVYYSVVTYTTLGYGDLYPVGPGRALASIQALTGYLTLGLLASTVASALKPGSDAGWEESASGR